MLVKILIVKVYYKISNYLLFKLLVYLPSLFILLPKKVPHKYHDGIKSNEQSLVFALDFFKTMLDIAGTNRSTYYPDFKNNA